MNTQAFDLPDGTRTVVEWFGDRASAPKGVVAFLPALGVSIDYYRAMATAWAGLGYQVATVELRGGKQSSVRDVRRQNFGYKEVLNLDLATILPALRQQAQGRRFLLAGHSLGGQLMLLYASRQPELAAGVILLAGGSNFYRSVPRGQRLKRQLSLRLVRLIDRLLGFFPGDKLGFGGRQPLNMMLDWTEEALTGKYAVKGDPADYDLALNQLNLPVLLLSLDGDHLVPKSSADFLASKLPQARVAQVEMAEAGKKYHHFRWTREPAPILARVDEWVGRTVRH